MNNCDVKSDPHSQWGELAAAGGVSNEKVLAARPSVERAIQRYVRSVQLQKKERAKAATIRNLHSDAIAVASGAPRSRRLALAEAVGALDPAIRNYLAKGEPFYGPLPTPEEIRNEAISRQAAARLRDLLQYGVAPPIWYQELNQLALAAESAENAFCIANGEVSDSAVDEIRRRRRDRARRRRSHAQKEVSKLFKILSKPAVKHLRIWARDAGVSVPSVEEFKSSRAAIRDILKIFEHRRKFAREDSRGVTEGLRPLLHAPDFRVGRPNNDLAHAFVGEMAIVWRHMTGKPPSRTASRHHPGPFVRFVLIALRMADAPHIDAVEAVNAWGSRGNV